MAIEKLTPTKVTTKASARKMLELSALTKNAAQREAMGTDVDVNRFALYLSQQTKCDLSDRITDGSITRSVEASSVLSVTVNDYDRSLLNSGLLYNRLDVELDGLWFRLSGVDFSSHNNELILSFEDREIAVLRTYNKWIMARRSKLTRAQFINSLIKQVKEFPIPVQIPYLHTTQVIERFDGDTIGKDMVVNKNKGLNEDMNTKTVGDAVSDILGITKATETVGDAVSKAIGIDKSGKVKVKTAVATKEQLTNARIIIQVGDQLEKTYPNYRWRKLKVCAILTAIHESTLRNIPHGDEAGPDSCGLFQQRDSWGSREERMDPATAAGLWYAQAMKTEDEGPGDPPSYEWTCLRTQFPGKVPAAGTYGVPFNNWRAQAEYMVTLSGSPGSDLESSADEANNQLPGGGGVGEFYFYRGEIVDNKHGNSFRKPEDSWHCIQRLAKEVNWKAFFVSGTFYYVSEDDLLKQQPLLKFNEFMLGVRSVEGNFYQKKESAALTISVDVGRWAIPPGAVVEVEMLGVFNGRWLVSEYTRNLFSTIASVTLVRERPKLPEPLQVGKSEAAKWAPDAQTDGVGGDGLSAADRVKYQVSLTGYSRPLPTDSGTNSEFANVDAEGAPDANGVKHHAGKDWFGVDGGNTIIIAPVAGKIVEAKPSTNNSGQVFGGTVKIEEGTKSINPNYVWVFRHVVPSVSVGDTVTQGQVIAKVTNWTDGGDHAHIEVWRTYAGGYNYENMVDPMDFFPL